MAMFVYTAMDFDGRRKKGMVEADSEKHTRHLLREQKPGGRPPQPTRAGCHAFAADGTLLSDLDAEAAKA